MRDFRDNLRGAEDKMLRLMREARNRADDSFLSDTGRPDTPPRAATRRFDRFGGGHSRGAMGPQRLRQQQ
eukprot:5198870-Karenia_brevis.AAC.1